MSFSSNLKQKNRCILIVLFFVIIIFYVLVFVRMGI